MNRGSGFPRLSMVDVHAYNDTIYSNDVVGCRILAVLPECCC